MSQSKGLMPCHSLLHFLELELLAVVLRILYKLHPFSIPGFHTLHISLGVHHHYLSGTGL